MENSVKQESGDVKQMNDKVENLESKTEIREMKRKRHKLALLELTRRTFV